MGLIHWTKCWILLKYFLTCFLPHLHFIALSFSPAGHLPLKQPISYVCILNLYSTHESDASLSESSLFCSQWGSVVIYIIHSTSLIISPRQCISTNGTCINSKWRASDKPLSRVFYAAMVLHSLICDQLILMVTTRGSPHPQPGWKHIGEEAWGVRKHPWGHSLPKALPT